jgi:hypothetical protein
MVSHPGFERADIEALAFRDRLGPDVAVEVLAAHGVSIQIV